MSSNCASTSLHSGVAASRESSLGPTASRRRSTSPESRPSAGSTPSALAASSAESVQGTATDVVTAAEAAAAPLESCCFFGGMAIDG